MRHRDLTFSDKLLMGIVIFGLSVIIALATTPPVPAQADSPVVKVLPDPEDGLYGMSKGIITQDEFHHDVMFTLGRAFEQETQDGHRFDPEDPNFVIWAKDRLARFYEIRGIIVEGQPIP